ANVFLFAGLETLRLHSDRKDGDWQQREEVVSRVIGLCVASETRGFRSDLHRRSGDHRPGLVGHRSGKTAVRLTVKTRTEGKHGTQNRYEQRISFQHQFSTLVPLTPSGDSGPTPWRL